MKHCGKIAGGLGLALLTGLCGCGKVQIRHNDSEKGNVDIHIDAKDENGHFTLNIKGDIGGTTVSETVKQTYTASNVATLKVVETSGNIQIVPQVGDANEVTITATKHVNGEESESLLKPLLKHIKPMVRFEDGVLNVYTQREEKQFDKRAGWIDYEIRVPKRIAAQAEVSSGNVKIEGLEGKVAVETSSGAIEMQRLGGEVHAKASSGDITLQNSELSNVLELETTSGKIEAEGVFAKNTALNVSLSASSGNIAYNGDAAVLKMKTTSGKQTATLKSAEALTQVDARASSGDIELTLPKNLKASLALNTSSGDIDLTGTDNDSLEEREHQNTINGGGSPISLTTTSGNISIETK